ncbi:hypothetical protein Tco_1395477, partial [Tanacetum coccineum]
LVVEAVLGSDGGGETWVDFLSNNQKNEVQMRSSIRELTNVVPQLFKISEDIVTDANKGDAAS